MKKAQIIKKIAENFSLGYVYPEILTGIVAPAELIREAFEEFDPLTHWEVEG